MSHKRNPMKIIHTNSDLINECSIQQTFFGSSSESLTHRVSLHSKLSIVVYFQYEKLSFITFCNTIRFIVSIDIDLNVFLSLLKFFNIFHWNIRAIERNQLNLMVDVVCVTLQLLANTVQSYFCILLSIIDFFQSDWKSEADFTLSRSYTHIHTYVHTLDCIRNAQISNWVTKDFFGR